MATEVIHNAKDFRYELLVDGEHAGLIDYTLDGDTIEIVHTEVDPGRQNEGLGSILVRGALDDIRETRTESVVPLCPYVATWINKHPEYRDLTTR